MTAQASVSHFPSFYDANTVGDIYLSRDGLVADEAIEFARVHNVKPASEDKFKIAFFGIDQQIGFCCPGASLFVPGAVEDSARTCEFIYRNLHLLTELHFSMDTHKLYQIFHPSFWTDNATGKPVAPFTLITSDDIHSGKYIPALFPHECLAYCEELEKTGKAVLCVWPYHTLLGSISHALVPAIFEASIFHAIARRKQTKFETKGTHPLTENYSVLSPEVKNVKGKIVGQFNTKFFKALMENDRVYIAGEAKSHCFKSTIEDLLEQIKTVDPTLVDKVYILEDCTSPVPAVIAPDGSVIVDFPAIADQAFEEFKKVGIHVVKSTDQIVLK